MLFPTRVHEGFLFMKTRQDTDPVHHLCTGDDPIVIAGYNGDMSVEELAAFLSHTDISEFVDPADRFTVVLDLNESADRLKDQQHQHYQNQNGHSAKFHSTPSE